MRGRLSPTIARWSPRLKPCAARPLARARTSLANCSQLQVCQMPRSFSRIAGRPGRTRAWCISSFGNVSRPARFSDISPSSKAGADFIMRNYSFARKDKDAGNRTLDDEGRCAAVFVAQAPGSGTGAERHDSVRARFVDGVAADLRPERAVPAGC